jgi:hypothetical protein
MTTTGKFGSVVLMLATAATPLNGRRKYTDAFPAKEMPVPDNRI